MGRGMRLAAAENDADSAGALSLRKQAAITNEIGLPIQMYLYDAYGRIINTTNDTQNSLTFVGRYGGSKDWDTGLMYFWHRWYDADLGRWINRDPIGIEGGI